MVPDGRELILTDPNDPGRSESSGPFFTSEKNLLAVKRFFQFRPIHFYRPRSGMDRKHDPNHPNGSKQDPYDPNVS